MEPQGFAAEVAVPTAGAVETVEEGDVRLLRADGEALAEREAVPVGRTAEVDVATDEVDEVELEELMEVEVTVGVGEEIGTVGLAGMVSLVLS